MTPDEINRLVAEKVMKWEAKRYCDHPFCPLNWNGDNLIKPIRVSEWDPYHRIDHAWMVLEECKKKGMSIILTNSGYEWFCEIFGVGATSQNVPAAICLVALPAFGVEVPDE